MFIKQDSLVYPCCFGTEVAPFGDVREDDFLDLANGEPMKALRRNMLEGRPSAHCTRCYDAEAAGFTSLRQHKNKEFADHLPRCRSTAPDGHVADFQLKYLDIRFSNICNFKCRFCGHPSSSLWYDEYMKLFPNYEPPRILKAGRSDDDLWRQIEKTLPHIECVYFAGGEPLIMKEHYMILNRLIELGRTNVTLSYNTNMSLLRYKDEAVLDLWKQFDKIHLGISIDGIGKRAEYIRKGTVWRTFVDNIRTVREQCPHISMCGNLTITIFNVMTFADIFQYIDDSGLFDTPPLNINFLTNSPIYCVQILPPAMKNRAAVPIAQLAHKLDGDGRQSEASSVRAINNFMNSAKTTELIPAFFELTDKLDVYRKESFDDTFPELADLRPFANEMESQPAAMSEPSTSASGEG
jgi:MoaA/NifB/PqqE/SkfB family radical SAM enzyme